MLNSLKIMQNGVWRSIRSTVILADLLVIVAISFICRKALAAKDEGESSSRHQQRQKSDDILGSFEAIKPQCEAANFLFHTLLLGISYDESSCQERCNNEIDNLKKLFKSGSEPYFNVFGEPLPLFIDICQALPGAVLELVDFKDLSGSDPSPYKYFNCGIGHAYCERPASRLKMSIGCECSSKLQFLLFSSEWLQTKSVIPGTVPRSGSLAAIFLQQDVCDVHSVHSRLKGLFQNEGLGLPESSTQLSHPYPCVDLQKELMESPGWFNTWIQSSDDRLSTIQTYVNSAQGPLQRWYIRHYGTEGYGESNGFHPRPDLDGNLHTVTSLDSVIHSPRARSAIRMPGALVGGEMMVPEDCPWSVVQDAQSFGSSKHRSPQHTTTLSGRIANRPSAEFCPAFQGNLWGFQSESHLDEHRTLDEIRRLSTDTQYPFSDEVNIVTATNEEATSRRRVGRPSLEFAQVMPSFSEDQIPATPQPETLEELSHDMLALWNDFMDHDFQLGPFL